uniref:STIM1/2 Orai1-activating region domain-containing protein n=1 Tax=Arion vulgaris TaxID=1028688 RepID=A0A0B7AB36_9EUPU
MAILLAIGISWFACLHHRYSQSQVKKMMKDLEALQKAEDALKKLSIELSDAEKPHSSIPGEKQGELKMFRQNSLHLQVPRMSIGDRSPTRTIKEAVVRHKQEGEFKLKQAEEELSSLRKALSDAENKLEIQQQLDSHWSMPEELQAWMQLTYELEHLNFSAKRQAAERQLLAARDGCEKIKKRKQAFFGSLRMAHSNSLDDIDQSILDARAALEEVKQDLQERLHRWHTIEVLCGFPIISNSGLTSLKQVLGRDSGSGTRMTNSMIAPVSFEEAEEDYQPTDENRGSESLYNQIPEKQRHQIFEWAHRSRHSYWMKKKMLNNAEENRGSDSEYNQIPEKPREQIFAWAHRSRDIYWTKKKMLMNDENKESESIYNQIPERPRQQIFAWAHRSRLNHWLKKKTVTNGHTATTIPAQTKSSAFNKIQTPPGSTGSLPHLSKVAAPGVSGGGNGKIENRDGELQGSSVGSSPATATSGSSAGSVVFQLGENFHHQRSHSSASLSPVNSNLTNGNRHGHTQVKSGPNQISHSTTATTSTSSGLRISSSSGNLSPAKTPARISNLSLKLTGSSSGNHISPRANMTTQSKTAFISPASITSEDTDEKHELNHTVDNINNNIISSNTGSISNTSNAVETSSDSANVQSHQQGKLLDDSDVSFISTPGTHFDQSPDSEHDGLEADSLQDSRQRGNEASAEKKNGKKKTLLPKFLQKSKGKQKTL